MKTVELTQRLRRALAVPSPSDMVAGAVAMVLIGFLPPAVRWINVPLVLWWPGRCLSVAIFGTSRWRNSRTDRIQAVGTMPPRLALDLVGSLVLWPGISLVAAGTGLRLTHRVVALAMMLMVIGLATITKVRHLAPSRRAINREAGAPSPGGHDWWAVPLMAVVAATGVGAASVAWMPRAEPQQYTEFALSDTWALLRAPVQVAENHPVRVRFEVTNRTDSSHRYVVSASSTPTEGGAPLTRWASVEFTLKPGQRHVDEIGGPIPTLPCRQRLTLRLNSDAPPSLAGHEGDNAVPAELRRHSPLTVMVQPLNAECVTT